MNGIDERTWNPIKDPYLVKPYGPRRFRDKGENKLALQRVCGLSQSLDTPVIGMVGRLVEQKGIDLVLDALPRLLSMSVQLIILGNGARSYERALRRLAHLHPDRLAVHIGYDEALAHRIEGGADMFLMPSRFEPCGLNQLYSLRYGTVPIVRRVGGLADTIIDADEVALAAGRATGVVFDDAEPGALVDAVNRALTLYRDARRWKKIALTGMRQRFTWRHSAQRYVEVYRKLVASATED